MKPSPDADWKEKGVFTSAREHLVVLDRHLEVGVMVRSVSLVVVVDVEMFKIEKFLKIAVVVGCDYARAGSAADSPLCG